MRMYSNRQHKPCEACSAFTPKQIDGTFTCNLCRSFYRRNILNAKKMTGCPTRECIRMDKQKKPCKGCRFRICEKAGIQITERRWITVRNSNRPCSDVVEIKSNEAKPCQVCSVTVTKQQSDGTFTCLLCRVFYRRNQGNNVELTACTTEFCINMTSFKKPCKGCRVRKCRQVGILLRDKTQDLVRIRESTLPGMASSSKPQTLDTVSGTAFPESTSSKKPTLNNTLEFLDSSDIEEFFNSLTEEHVTTPSSSGIYKTRDSEVSYFQSNIDSSLARNEHVLPLHKDSDAFNYQESSSYSMNGFSTAFPLDSGIFDNGTSSSAMASSSKPHTLDTVAFPQSTFSYDFNEPTLNNTMEFLDSSDIEEFFNSMTEELVTTPPNSGICKTRERFTPYVTVRTQYDTENLNGEQLEDYNDDYSFDWMAKPQQEVEVATEPSQNSVLLHLDGETTVNAAPIQESITFGINSSVQPTTFDTANDIVFPQSAPSHGFNELTLNNNLEFLDSSDIETFFNSLTEEHVATSSCTGINKTQDDYRGDFTRHVTANFESHGVEQQKLKNEESNRLLLNAVSLLERRVQYLEAMMKLK